LTFFENCPTVFTEQCSENESNLKKQESPDKKSRTREERLREASQQRRKQVKEEVRQAILQAASELFLKHGYEHFSLRQVAEQVGYSPGTIYLYFRDKDDILFTIMTDGATRFSQGVSDAISVPDARERLQRIGRAFVDFGLQNPVHYQLMFMQRPDFLLRSGAELPQSMIELLSLWRTIVEDAMKAGILRMGDPVSTGDTLWALLHGVVSIAILMPQFDRKRIDEMVETALEMMTYGLHKQ
jgi:AcrR family transcriptional regulator